MKKHVIHIAGGLANRMFQLAFALSVNKIYGEVFYDDKSQKAEFEHDKVDISNIFPNLKFKPMPNDMYKFGGKNGLIGKIARRLSLVTNERYYINHSDKFDSDFIFKLKKPGYIIGLFQDERYFKSVCNEVRELFTFPPLENMHNIVFLEELKTCESVAIHIRKGDGYASWKQFEGTCGVEYYKTAVGYIKSRYPQAKFYVFTDSPSWVIEHMQWLDYEKMVDWNPTEGWGNHWDMQLMSLCRHNIIANSTYSWWGAWLNPNPHKIVIAPQNWFSSTCNRKKELIPPLWIKM